MINPGKNVLMCIRKKKKLSFGDKSFVGVTKDPIVCVVWHGNSATTRKKEG